VRVLLADLDGDGGEEAVLVSAGPSGCKLARIVGTGEGTVFPPIVLGEETLHAPALSDIDGDRKADLLSVSERGIGVHKGLGGGRFDPVVRILYESPELLVGAEGCEVPPPYALNVFGDERAELVLPISGGVRIVSLAEEEPQVGPEPIDLLAQPAVRGGGYGLSFLSPLPVLIGSGASRVLLLGPILEARSPRLEFSWWTLSKDGSLEGHRTALALPPGEGAVLVFPFDLEGDGRPEMAVLTAPRRMEKLLGEFGLSVYRASDRAEAPVAPFFTASTRINYWQFPAFAYRPRPGGGELMLAFYRGLVKEHLNVVVYRSNGTGSFDQRAKEIDLSSAKGSERALLIWTDVDADGAVDLATAAEAGLRVHRGSPDAARPLSSDPVWTAPFVAGRREGSISLGSEEGWSISVGGPRNLWFHDLDGDWLAELIALAPGEGEKPGAPRAGAARVEKLRPTSTSARTRGP
jgi:hypothetical protein